MTQQTYTLAELKRLDLEYGLAKSNRLLSHLLARSSNDRALVHFILEECRNVNEMLDTVLRSRLGQPAWRSIVNIVIGFDRKVYRPQGAVDAQALASYLSREDVLRWLLRNHHSLMIDETHPLIHALIPDSYHKEEIRRYMKDGQYLRAWEQLAGIPKHPVRSLPPVEIPERAKYFTNVYNFCHCPDPHLIRETVILLYRALTEAGQISREFKECCSPIPPSQEANTYAPFLGGLLQACGNKTRFEQIGQTKRRVFLGTSAKAYLLYRTFYPDEPVVLPLEQERYERQSA